jgi:Ca2+-binding RTX toxin-like protein
MPVQNTDRNTQWLLNLPNETWILTKDAKITTLNEDAILEGQNNSEIIIRGDIKVTGIGRAGIRFDGSTSSVDVGKDSFINCKHAFYGISADGAGSDIVNRGVIRGVEAGIHGAIWADVTNFGTVGGHVAMFFEDDGAQIYNHGKLDGGNYGVSAGADGTYIFNDDGAQILGPLTAILLNGVGDAEILNRGTIDGGFNAIQLDSGGLHLVNKGKIFGDIVLADGTNFIDTRKGEFKGTISGEAGDETILISSKVKFTDGDDSDYDRVSSLVSYKLGMHVEALDLRGSKNINAIGSALDNDLTGNSGNNRLKGLNGEDDLYGGKGNDVMIGGIANDIFHFQQGDGVDRITDFVDGGDLIESQMVQSQLDFDNLNIVQANGNLVIKFGGGDRLIIEDMLKSDFAYDNFA